MKNYFSHSLLAVELLREASGGGLLGAGANVRHLMNALRETPHARFIAAVAPIGKKPALSSSHAK